MTNKGLNIVEGIAEKELMRNCAHFGSKSGHNGILEVLKNSRINWKLFINLIRVNCVFPIVYENLSHYKDLIPKEIQDDMRLINMSLTMIILKKYVFVKEMAQVLHDNSIKACIMKGPILSLQIYGKPAYRDFCDIDILISENDYCNIVKILLSKGYKPARNEFLELKGFEAVKFAHYNEQIRFLKDGFLNIEIHFRLMNIGNPTPKEDYIWDVCSLKEYDGCKFWVLRPEDTMIFLIIHGVQHRFSRFSLLTDIMGFYAKFFPNFSLNRFHNTVEYCGAKNVLKHTEIIMRLFYDEFSIVPPNKGRRSSLTLEVINKFILGQRKISNLNNVAFPQRFEAPIFFIFFIQGRKIFFIKNVLYFAYKYHFFQ